MFVIQRTPYSIERESRSSTYEFGDEIQFEAFVSDIDKSRPSIEGRQMQGYRIVECPSIAMKFDTERKAKNWLKKHNLLSLVESGHFEVRRDTNCYTLEELKSLMRTTRW